MQLSDPSELRGLSDAQAAELRARFGPNVTPSTGEHGWPALLAEVLREPMFMLLLCASAVYLALGEPSEASLLLGFVAIVMALTVFQSYRTAQAMNALRALSAPRAQVVRDGVRRLVSASELVPGDVVWIDEGARVPADGTLFAAHELSVDEALLSGESVPVVRFAGDPAFAGSLVVQGQGTMQITATGPRTVLGGIGKSLTEVAAPPSPLQREVRLFVMRFAVLAVALCVLLALAYRWRLGAWLPGVLAGITLGMGIVPEEIPVVLTVFMALGARRVAREGMLTRRLSALEALGQTSVLCVDKTGTLTQNRMTVRALYARGRELVLDEHTAHVGDAWHELLEYLVLASEIEPFDPMERAFHQTARRCLAGTEHLHDDWSLVREYPLSPVLPAMSHGWENAHDSHWTVAAKGAPEAIATLCRIEDDGTRALLAQAERLAERGLRVLAVARARHPRGVWPTSQQQFGFELVGLVGLDDPVRPEVAGAVAQCRGAGVRVVMITGDYPSTARAVAAQIGIDGTRVATGTELAKLDDASLGKLVAHIDVFARITPQQKLRLVEVLQARGEVVAMTGDGVNDAPALKAAHVGIAMGRRGAEVAREAAALVLLGDEFTPIVSAIRLGRRLYANLVQAVSYTAAVHVPMVTASILPILLGWPPMLGPAHIVFLELIINPVCSLVFENEPEHPRLMRTPPRRIGTSLMASGAVLAGAGCGTLVAVAILAVYALMLARGSDASMARTGAFVLMTTGNVALIFVVRVLWGRSLRSAWQRSNTYLWVVLLVTAFALLALLTVAPLTRLFGMVPLADFMLPDGMRFR